MGLFGLSLLFVGITLIMNGVNRLSGVAPRSAGVMNLFTGSILLIGNVIALTQAGEVLAYQHAASGLLYAVVYLYIAANDLFHLDLRPFGWYALLVAVYTTVMAALAFGEDVRIALLWCAWATLLYLGFLEIVPRLKLYKFPAYASILAGILAGFLPAVLILTGAW